jgi:hypothetical protein
MTAVWRREAIRCGEAEGATRPGKRSWVVKFGGSLLSRPHWPDELRGLLDLLEGPRTIVVGGGAIVDGLRSIDAASPRSPELMHHLAIEAMGITARLVAAVIGLPVAVVPASSSGVVVLDASSWLAAGGRAAGLPIGWQVTSDSIAAAVAGSCGAGLLLAKSVPPPAVGLPALVASGWLDPFFPTAATSLAEIHWAAPFRPGQPRS